MGDNTALPAPSSGTLFRGAHVNGGRLHALRSQVERPAEGPPRIWLRAAEVDAL